MHSLSPLPPPPPPISLLCHPGPGPRPPATAVEGFMSGAGLGKNMPIPASTRPTSGAGICNRCEPPHWHTDSICMEPEEPGGISWSVFLRCQMFVYDNVISSMAQVHKKCVYDIPSQRPRPPPPPPHLQCVPTLTPFYMFKYFTFRWVL